ncbi:MAG: bifunctional oligoribonuclease/PAP phosphatase NrnA [Prevotella ruminicola]|jgi:phosphoesterase RecJ-like protein|uniref:Bifunctional oligoribonuclease/PAP phosphatase NrnA n=1 Tax=Xylanibacter ruminicola TaxID=839 RepID=A0A9D5P1Z4_XYLRU|nr:bifunctional oligoribonuclease/PAP phosphatase NrnA [Xylanibacter ruminicola]
MNIDILNNDQLALMDQLISDANTVLVVCHKSPDGDAIGSSLAWAEYMRLRGKDVTVIVPDQYPDFLLWLPNTEKIVRYDKHREKCDMLFKIADLVFCLDFNTPSRVDEMSEVLVNSPAKKILIDHHLKPDVPAALIVSHPDASSTCELVFRIVYQMGAFPQLDKAFAAPVYCGMMTDTGGFTYNSSNPELYFIIGELLTKHIDKDRIYRNVFHNYSENRIRLMGYVLYEKLVYMPEYHAAYYSLTRNELKRFNYIKGDTEGLVNMPQQIKGLKLSISLREDTEKPVVWVSLRSVDDFPCNLMAEEFFNGGGHLNASGGKIEGTIEEAIEITKKAISAYENKLK